MLGLKRNCLRLFANRGKVFLIALDHSQYMGCVEGLEDPCKVVRICKDSPVDGFVLSTGIMQRLDLDVIGTKKVVLRVDVGGSKFSQRPLGCLKVLPSWTAVALGADAVIAMLPLSDSDEQILGPIALAVQEFHFLSIPVILEVLPNPALGISASEQVVVGARIAAELGADAVKVPYVERFKDVVSCCPVPVLMAGGQKDVSILATARAALDAGARGLVVGRNVFQAEDPHKVIFELEALLRP